MHLLLGPNVCPCTIVSAPSWHCIEQRIFRMRSSSLLLAIFLFMTLRSVQQRYKYNPFFSDQLVHFVNRGSLGLANDFLSLGFLPEGVDMQLVPEGVDMVFMILDGMLVRPYGLFSTIQDCIGATIAWPCPFISVVRED